MRKSKQQPVSLARSSLLGSAQARGAFVNGPTRLLPLLRCLQLQTQSVNLAVELIRQHLIHHTVPLNSFHVPELVRNHDHLEMGL